MVSEGHPHSKGPRGESLLASYSFQEFQAILALWTHISNLCSYLHMVSPSSPVSLFVSFIRTFVIGFRAPVIIQNDLKILNLITSAMILFSKKGHIHKLQGLRYRHIFLGLPYNPLQYGVSIHILLLTHFIF